MRTLNKLTLAAASLAMVLGVAGQASATSSINLVYLDGATGDPSCTSSAEPCIHTNESDIIRFAINIVADSLGVAGYGFDLQWDTDLQNELDFVHMRKRTVLQFDTGLTGGSPPAPLFNEWSFLETNVTTQESTAGQRGFINGFDATGDLLLPMPTSVSFRVAVVAFHVNGNVQNDGTDIEIGFFRLDGNAFGTAGFASITPDFGTFAVDSVPEPGTSLLMGMGVLGLIMAGRASRKS
jgi:hypothetical protein